MSQLPTEPGPDGFARGSNTLPPDLPPVEPPSAGFILQLFVIPAVIVAVLIVVVALFGKLAEGRNDTTHYVEAIRSDNPNVQFRAAYELANLIQNEAELSKDPKLLGELSGLLERELDRKSPDPRVGQFVAVALGVFQILEVPNLSGSHRPLSVLASAMATGRPIEVRVAATEAIARQAARLKGSLDDPEVIQALARAAEDPEPELRQRAVYALGFIESHAAVEVLRKSVQKDEDRFVRYNAASALARRGDVAALDVVREMLSREDLGVALKSKNDAETNHRIESIQLEVLGALATSVKDKKPFLAERVRPQIGKLSSSPWAGVRMEAASLLKSLPAAP